MVTNSTVGRSYAALMKDKQEKAWKNTHPILAWGLQIEWLRGALAGISHCDVSARL
jgi:hypothetical protein